MWKLKNEPNEQNRNKLINTKNIFMVAIWKEFGGTGRKGEGIKKYNSGSD